MDLNFVCGPNALPQPSRQSQQHNADASEADSPVAALPNIRELESIRASLATDGGAVAAENNAVASIAAPFCPPARPFTMQAISNVTTEALARPSTMAFPASAVLVAPHHHHNHHHHPPPHPSHLAGEEASSAYPRDSGRQPESLAGTFRMSTLQFSNHNAAAVAAEQQQSNDDIVNDKAAGKCASPSGSSSCEKKRTTILEKYQSELRDVADKCKILSQFSEQYGPEKNKFNAQPSDDLVIDMARKAYEVLLVFMTIRRERMSTSADDDTMDYIRKRRTVLSPARSKARKRSKRSDAAQPNTCRSCGISETPEWRRGPDGARTLCNACGLHYAKLSKKRANEATTHFSADNTAPASAAAGAGASVTPNSASDSNTPLVLAAVSHNPPHHVGASGGHPSISGILSSAQSAPGPSAGMARAPLPLPQHAMHNNYQQQHRSVPVQPASAHMAYAQQQQILPPHQPHSAPIHGTMHQEYVHPGSSSGASNMPYHSQQMQHPSWQQQQHYYQQQQHYRQHHHQQAPVHALSTSVSTPPQHISQAMPHINGTGEHANNFMQTLYSNSNANSAYPTASNGGGNGSNPTRQRVHEHQKPVKTSISRIIG